MSQFYEIVNRKSGLLAVSETSSDMRDLLSAETHDLRAAVAVARQPGHCSGDSYSDELMIARSVDRILRSAAVKKTA